MTDDETNNWNPYKHPYTGPVPSDTSPNPVTAVLLDLLSNYFTHCSGEDVNSGWCHFVGREVLARIPEARDTWDWDLDRWTHQGHVIILYRNRYYDIEAPEGVDNWRDLPIYSRPDCGWRQGAEYWDEKPECEIMA